MESTSYFSTLRAAFLQLFDFQTNQVVPLIGSVLVAFVLGMFIYLIYRLSFSGVVYSKTFNMSLVMLTMVSTMVILFMSNNLKLSLGMVGALSIVRFRTAIKDPIDTVFMFWAIGVGIALGAGFVFAAVVGTILIGFLEAQSIPALPSDPALRRTCVQGSQVHDCSDSLCACQIQDRSERRYRACS